MKTRAISAIAAITLVIILILWQQLKENGAKILVDSSTTSAVLITNLAGQSNNPLNLERAPISGRDEWKSPVNFWGIVVEPDGTPIVDATVVFEWTDLSPDGSSKEILKSGTDGRVQLVNRTGKRLLVRASKSGFETMDKAGISWEFSDKTSDLFRVADERNPVRIFLRRRGGPDSLIRRFGIRVPLPSNERAVGFDVVSQTGVDPLSSRADIVFEITPGRVREVLDDRFDWRVVIRAPRGGVMFGAKGAWEVPEMGFVSDLVVEMRKESVEWVDYLDRWIYFRSREGQVQGLAHIYIAPSPRRAPLAVAIEEYVANPFGGRGLEYARETDVTAQFYRPPE